MPGMNIKNAAVSLLNKGFSPEYRSETEKLGGGMFRRITADIAADRGLDEGNVKKAVDEAPVAAEKALEKKLIDKIAYKPDLIEQVMDETGGEMINLVDYALNIKEGRKKPSVCCPDGYRRHDYRRREQRKSV